MSETKNESTWKKLFDKYKIAKQIEDKGFCKIQAYQIKEFREPRLMTKL